MRPRRSAHPREMIHMKAAAASGIAALLLASCAAAAER
jgi:hypothetical protein